jgi:hypothetical protein
MEITQVTRPVKKMRYPSAGDYLYKLGVDRFNFIIAEMKNPDYEFLVFVHELIEAYLCWKAKIKEEDITAFDVKFKADGKEGEPGEDKNAPYFDAHAFASGIEMLCCNKLGIAWNDYDDAINKLFED